MFSERDNPCGRARHPEVTGTSAVVTESGTNGDLYYWYNPGGDTSWHARQAVAAGSGDLYYEEPSLAITGNSVVISAASTDGVLYYSYEPFGTSAWHQHLVYAAGDFEEQGASIGVTSSLTMIAGLDNTDTPGDVDYFSQPFGSGTWDIEGIDGGCC
ncbi:MAG TPA: hypothetical protein VGH27_04020 [Streptosporangiaceae bacterium]|jgi:hypothetical protein